MTRQSYLFFLCLLAPLFLANCQSVNSCNDELGCVVIAPGEPIPLGYMLVTSGENANLGLDALGGIEIALADRDHSLLGHPLELVGADSRCSSEGGEAAVQEILQTENLVGIIGPSCSSAAIEAIPVISEAGLIMISPSTTGPSLTNPDRYWQPGFFRTAHNDQYQGSLAAEFARIELGAKSAATIHDGSLYTDELQKVFGDIFEQLGGVITARTAIVEGETDMRALLEFIGESQPDVLYFPIFEPEGNHIAKQAADIPGLQNTILIGADGLLTATFAPQTGLSVVGMYLSGPYLEGPTYDNFLNKWEERFDDSPPSSFHAFAYDATDILLNVIQNTAQLLPDGTLIIGRQALRDAVANINSYEGISGSITCNQWGDCATGEALAMYRLIDEQVRGEFPPEAVWNKTIDSE